MLIQLTGKVATDYTGWLELYERQTGKAPTAVERVEAYFAAKTGTRPSWGI